MTSDEAGMRAALEQARLASLAGEIPVGAALTDGEGRILAAAHNRREETNDPLSHAEAEVLRQAAGARESRYFTDCTLYVTLEPCPMCAGAIINSRIDRVVFGASDPKAGCAGSVINLFEMGFNHKPEVAAGVLGDECAGLLSEFFRGLREKRKERGK